MDIIDSIDLGQHSGFDIRADLVPDMDAANAADIDMVGIIVTASRAGIDLGSDSLWGITHGITDPLRDSNSSFMSYRADLIGFATGEARVKLAELNGAGK